MDERIFISYRTADGVDKATALARDLGQVFGDAAVFLDKDDLGAGSAWRAEISRAIDARPVLLLLVTPQLLTATDDQGQLRIATPDDPVRRELAAAFAAGARIIPLLPDGLSGAPDMAALPEPFNRLGDLTWRPLRAYDWAPDVERLVADLEALGVPRADTAPINRQLAPPARPARRNGLLGLLAATVALAGGAWWLLRPVAPAGIDGRWQAQLWQGESVVVVLAEQGDTVTLASEPIAITERPDWQDYRAFWLKQGGSPLEAIMYLGEGRRIAHPGVPVALDIALRVMPSPAVGSAIDGGNLSLQLSADGRALSGRIWLNGAQAEQAAVLTRLR